MRTRTVKMTLAFVMIALLSQCSDSETKEGNNGNVNNSSAPCVIENEKYLSAEEVAATIDSGCAPLLLLNVMPADMYTGGHIDGSVEIPYDELADRLDEVAADQTIIVYCKGGTYSESAYDTLIGAGYTSVWVLQGGLNAWEFAGYEVVPVE